MRFIALVLLSAFLFSCTKAVPRGGVETRHFRVAWEKLDAQVLNIGDLELRGVVLTPAQLPLEAGLSRLFEGDFIGFIDSLDLNFQASRLPDGVLQDLYDEGFLPAYLQVRNPGPSAIVFNPLRLAVNVDENLWLNPAAVDELPPSFRKTDWATTGLAVAAIVLVVVLLAMQNNSDRSPVNLANIHGPDIRGISTFTRGDSGPLPPPGEQGYLRETTLAPSEVREGIVFFKLGGSVADWTTARLVENK